MNLFDELGELVKKAAAGNAPAADVHAAYDRVAEAMSQGAIADGLAHTFKSDQTPPFEEMVADLFSRSAPEQKTVLLKLLAGTVGPASFAQTLMLPASSDGSVTPQLAEGVSPETVKFLAQQAATTDPSIIEKAARFYALHPTLVKSIGVAALGLLMSRVATSRR